MSWPQHRGDDGLVWWSNMPAEGYRVRVTPTLIDGQAVAVGLQVEAMPGAHPAPLTQTALKRIPLSQLAAIAAAEDVSTFVQSLTRPLDAAAGARASRNLREAVAQMRAPGAVEVAPIVELAADVWNAAYAQGRAPRDEVVEKLHTSTRTADRLIARARAAGLIVAPKRGGGRRAPKGGAQ